MELTRIVPEGRQLIQAYREGGFTIAGARHEGSVLVLPDRTLPWAVSELPAVTLESLAPITGATEVEILILGCGARFALAVGRAAPGAADARHRDRIHGHAGRVPHLQRPARRGPPGRGGPDRALRATRSRSPLHRRRQRLQGRSARIAQSTSLEWPAPQRR